MTVEINAARLRHDVVLKGWSAPQLAKRAHVAAFSVSRILKSGRCRPGTIAKLAKALGQPIDRYLVETEELAGELS